MRLLLVSRNNGAIPCDERCFEHSGRVNRIACPRPPRKRRVPRAPRPLRPHGDEGRRNRCQLRRMESPPWLQSRFPGAGASFGKGPAASSSRMNGNVDSGACAPRRRQARIADAQQLRLPGEFRPQARRKNRPRPEHHRFDFCMAGNGARPVAGHAVSRSTGIRWGQRSPNAPAITASRSLPRPSAPAAFRAGPRLQSRGQIADPRRRAHAVDAESARPWRVGYAPTASVRLCGALSLSDAATASSRSITVNPAPPATRLG